MLSHVESQTRDSQVLERLHRLCTEHGHTGLGESLLGLADLVDNDLRRVEEGLNEVVAPENLVQRAAGHLLDLSGKRIRPLCVALASRVGLGFGPRALDLAVAVELIHSSTLLHDDVVDLAAERRGSPAARVEFGNAASIFAGDWLLIRALQRVQRSAPDALDSLLGAIAEMIAAESLQLENRGRIETSRQLYFQIAEGKSATLFRWAMEAGGRAGELDDEACAALQSYGLQLGVAFQVIDDLLDLTGDVRSTGKVLFADLREGKMTYPLIVAVEEEPRLRMVLEEIVRTAPGQAPSEALCRQVLTTLEESGAARECRDLAQERAEAAIHSLQSLPRNDATVALELVARSSVHRRH